MIDSNVVPTGWTKVKVLLQSRKFWALILALATIGVSIYTKAVLPTEGLLAAIGAMSAYMVGTGLDG